MFRLCLLLLSFSPLFAENYADALLAQVEDAAKVAIANNDPVEAVLMTERLYYLAHETGDQERVLNILESLYKGIKHQEARGEIGYFMSQHLRQLGRHDEVASLVKEQGHISGWRVLGPLSNKDFDLRPLLKADSVQGLDRTVVPINAHAYGRDDYWSSGFGHYGFFNTNGLIYPTQLAGVLYSTWVKLDSPSQLRLALGWQNQVRVWINTTQIHEERARFGVHPDQRAFYLSLKKGWHRISVFVAAAAEESNVGLYARLTDMQGQPVATRLDGPRRLRRAKPTLLDPVEPSLLELAKSKGDSAIAAMLLVKERKSFEDLLPIDYLRRALAKEPNRDIAQRLLSMMEDPNQEWALLIDFLDKAPVTAKIDRAWAYTQLGQIALAQDRFWEARKYASEALETAPNYWPATVLENNTLSNLRLGGQALRNTLDLAEAYPKVPWIVMDLSDLYYELEYQEEAEALTDKVLKLRGASQKFADRKISYLKQAGDLDALDAFYSHLLRDAPFSVGSALGYAGFLIANRRYDKADKLLSEYLEMMPENPHLLQRMGELHLRQERRDAALPFLKKALALRPQNPDLEKLLAFSQESVTHFYEAYRVADTPEAKIFEVSDIVVNVDNTVVKVSPNGQSSTYHQLEWEIVSEEGIEELPGYAFSYAPLRQKAEVVRGEVLRGDQVIHISRFGRARISDPAYRMYYDLVSYQVAFPPLEVGDRVRLEYRIDDTGSTNIFGDYFGDLQYFAQANPVRLQRYTLIMPADRKVHYHVEKMKPEFEKSFDGKNNVFQWQLNSVSPYETESRMPGLAGYMPYVAISTFNNWQDMAKWYNDLIRDQLDLDRETASIAEKLADGVSDRLEIVKRIHEYVISHTRYVALEFGIHGYKPYQVNQVNNRQFGDCKDKASLIVSMLRHVGIPAQISIVRTADKGDVHTFPAMLAYFNHAIAYVPEFDLYLDGTAEFSGIEELPTMDQGALTLLVDENGVGKLTKIPISQDNLQVYDFKLDLDSNGAAQVEGSISYKGAGTPGLREFLSIDAKLSQNIQKMMRDTLPGLDIQASDREGRTINEPITLNFSGQTRQLLQVGTDQMALSLDFLNDALTQVYAANARRTFPIDFGVPKTRRVQLTVAAPEGFKIDQVPETLEVEDSNFAARLGIERADARTLRLNYQVEFKSHRVQPEDYPSLRKLLQEHDRLLDKNIIFKSL